MDGTNTVTAKLERAATILAARPDKARQSHVVSSRLHGAVGSRVEVAGHLVETDMPTEVGGGDTAPSPGKLLLAAVAACLTTGAAQACARHGLKVEDIQVQVEADIDTRGVFCPDLDVSAAFENISARIEILTPEDPGAIRSAMQESAACSTVNQTLALPPRVAVVVLPTQQA